jgi:hypothetical protein
MKKIFILFTTIACLGTSAFGKTVDVATAKIVAANQYKKAGGSADLELAYTATSKVNGADVAAYYVFSATAGNGFVIVSADDVVKPILAYSVESSFPTDNLSPEVAYWLAGYQQHIVNVIKKQSVTEANAGWSVLKSGATAAKTTNTAVAALLTTAWDQTYYYNRLCPFDASANQNTVTGCVATAMGQVMKYWNWPIVGEGSHSYNSPYGTLTANFGTTYYNWPTMHNVVTQAHSDADTLIFDAGVSVNMNYGTAAAGGSGASVFGNNYPCAEKALRSNFRYVSTLHGEQRSDYATADWITLLKGELDSSRPMLYVGYGPAGGHCWVCDGYDVNNNFHFNWGWSGVYNGYYSVDSLEPGGPGGDSFNDYTGAVVGIMPDSSNSGIYPASIGNIGTVQMSVSVYPNPAKDIITIAAANNQHISTVTLTDMSGRAISVYNAENNPNTTLPLANVAEGMYLLQVQTENGITTKKIVVSK